MRVPYRFSQLKGRVEAFVFEFISAHIEKTWFSPVFWGAMAGSVAMILVIMGFLNRGVLIPFILLGAVFGLWMARLDPSLSRMASRLEAKASAGDPIACRRLALAYLNGAPGLPRDLDVARKWFLAGAEGGDREAMVQLAELMTWGLGGVRDPDGALAWKRRSQRVL